MLSNLFLFTLNEEEGILSFSKHQIIFISLNSVNGKNEIINYETRG